MSVSVITPAVAGPFDLGTVVSRNALFIDPETAQGHVVSDPLPTILDGVPLRLRSIDVNLDRPDFTLNPTNCTPMAVNAKLTSTDGASSSPSSYFQVGNCKALSFKPGLSLALKGGTKRSDNPALTATLNYPKGSNYANIASTTVLLPSSEFIDNAHINNPCTRVQFAANACPPSSVLGTATAYTPLLEKPLTGPVYFRSNGGERELPDMVVDLNGQIHVTLVGFIDSKERLRKPGQDPLPQRPRCPGNQVHPLAQRRQARADRKLQEPLQLGQQSRRQIHRPKRQDRQLQDAADQQLQEGQEGQEGQGRQEGQGLQADRRLAPGARLLMRRTL